MRLIPGSGLHDRFGVLRVLAMLAIAVACGASRPVVDDGISFDPLTITDADFVRNRDPALWQGLRVERIVFTEGGTIWRLWRIVNVERSHGPLWVVTHDNENATFAAALASIRAWGGVAMIVDTVALDTSYAARYNHETSGRPIDPNRNFGDAQPGYVATMLADALAEPRLIVALHTNAADFDPALSDCPARRAGRGMISVGLCNARYGPRAAQDKRWPFDDEDSLVLVPFLDGRDPRSAFCAGPLITADMNLVFERVAASDGSLSNYAVQHGLPYVNVETEERGSSATGIGLARDRLVKMIDTVMERCGPLPGIALKPRRKR